MWARIYVVVAGPDAHGQFGWCAWMRCDEEKETRTGTLSARSRLQAELDAVRWGLTHALGWWGESIKGFDVVVSEGASRILRTRPKCSRPERLAADTAREMMRGRPWRVRSDGNEKLQGYVGGLAREAMRHAEMSEDARVGFRPPKRSHVGRYAALKVTSEG